MNLEPGIIKKLDDVVINRIAAGEIIQRPANALKELLENSLDAKSSFIQVTIKSGGLKLLQIQDNGTGIRKEDLSIVCERFTTSKLKRFEDLSNIATYGFRGEALSSISHVAHLTIQTKTAQERCGYRAQYEDGKLTANPKPCAGNQGTTITIEDLFYNMPQRKLALKSPAEEFQKISDVLSKYAIHNANVGFTLKKVGEQPSLKTAVSSTQEQNIQTVYGAQVAKELFAVSLTDAVHKFSMSGFISKVNYSSKKGIMIVFINHRLVESPGLKTAIDNVYSTYLPKGMHPFIYISLELEPTNVDVNVHPTKHEVHFLYEDEIIDKIKSEIEQKLLGSNETRSFYKQLKIVGGSEPLAGNVNASSSTGAIDKQYAKEMVRTDATEQKLDKFLKTQTEMSFRILDKTNLLSRDESYLNTSGSTSTQLEDESFQALKARITKEVKLTSVLNMQKKVERNCSLGLRKTLKELVFVGIVNKTFGLFQYETKLFLCNTAEFCEELFYQRLVYEFQNMPQIKISPPLSVIELMKIALNTEEAGWSEEDGEKSKLAESAADILIAKSPMLREYFSLDITADGHLQSLPIILHQHTPCVAYLPIYLLRLATDVIWEEEEQCFETLCRETARYYSLYSNSEIQENQTRHKWQVEHVIYPAFKRYLLPPVQLKKHLYELTSLPRLYKVFERC